MRRGGYFRSAVVAIDEAGDDVITALDVDQQQRNDNDSIQFRYLQSYAAAVMTQSSAFRTAWRRKTTCMLVPNYQQA